MTDTKAENVWNVALPWSDGCMSARLWRKGKGVIVSVPEVGISCYGKSQSEAILRLFSNLLKYYNQLKSERKSLGSRQLEHLQILTVWVRSVEQRMCAPELTVASLPRGR